MPLDADIERGDLRAENQPERRREQAGGDRQRNRVADRPAKVLAQLAETACQR